MTRVLLPSRKALGRVLGISPAALREGERRGKIEPTGDGTWDLGLVLHRWRHYTRMSLQRSPRSWLDPEQPVTPGMLRMLARRAVAEGATPWCEGASCPPFP